MLGLQQIFIILKKWSLRRVDMYCHFLPQASLHVFGFMWERLMPVSSYETQSIIVVKLWVCTVWEFHWVTLDLKQSGHFGKRYLGVVPELVPDSPRKHFLKESVFFLKKKKIYLMISIRRSRDIAPYSLCLCVCNICVLCCAKSLSRVWLFAIPGTVAYQAPLSMSILQTILEWLPCPSPGQLLNPRTEPRSPALQADSLPYEPYL